MFHRGRLYFGSKSIDLVDLQEEPWAFMYISAVLDEHMIENVYIPLMLELEDDK